MLRTPTLSHRDATIQAARELTHALQNLNNANPLSQLSDDQLRALHQLSTFFPPGMTEFRQPLQVQSHLEMPRILVQLGHTQRTWKLAPQTDPKWSPTWSLTRFQPICPLSERDGRYACQVSRAHRTHNRL